MKSSYFDIEKITEGVFAALAVEDTGAWGNAGFVDLGETTLVFDSMLTPRAASDLRRSAEHFTNKPVSHLVNRHYHFDHVLGNQVFKDVTIVSTTRTRELIIENLDIANFTSIQRELRKDNEELSLQITTENDPWIQRWLHNEITEQQNFIEALPHMQLTLPNQTFMQKTEIKGSKRRVNLLSYGGGHTKSDAFMYLPDDGIAFMGDLVLVDTHPMLATGNPDEWLTILDKLKSLPIETIVPGHGKVGQAKHISDMFKYITQIQNTVQQAKSEGISLSKLLDSEIPIPYQSWRFAHVYKWNLKFLFTQQNTK